MSEPIEEELIPGYKPKNFYPVSLGKVLNSRYRVVTKLGCGVGSTIWLARDISNEQYRTLEVCVREKEGSTLAQQAATEILVSEYLRYTAPVRDHPGKAAIRTVIDYFEVPGPHGLHKCLVYPALGMTFTELRDRSPDQVFGKRMLQHTIQYLLIAIEYLHQNGVVHTDLSLDNIQVTAADASVFTTMEEDELAWPTARKVLSDRTIYVSRPVPTTNGPPMVCDLGSARIDNGGLRGDIMPGIYRAPEVILGMPWSAKVDIWSIATMIFDLFEDKPLFFAHKQGKLNDEQHLAEMVSIMGNPPRQFLQRSEKCKRYWDANGNWIAKTPIPTQSLETREVRLHGEEKRALLDFLRRILRWCPEERPAAEDLAYDDFLMGAYLQRMGG